MKRLFHAHRGNAETAIVAFNVGQAGRAISQNHRVSDQACLPRFAQNRAFRRIGVETSASLRYTFGLWMPWAGAYGTQAGEVASGGQMPHDVSFVGLVRRLSRPPTVTRQVRNRDVWGAWCTASQATDETGVV